MSDNQTTGAQDPKTNDDASARRGQWSVVSRRSSTRQLYGAFSLQKQCAPESVRGFTLAKQRERASAFTLAELLVSIGVLALVVFFATQLLKSAATVTILGHKRMDIDSQSRQLLDRMSIDFAQMVKRSDVDYYVKSSAGAPRRTVLQPGNDRIAFYSTVPGYYPSTGSAQSPVSLVAYRVNSNPSSSAYNKLERMGKGLLWNGFTAPGATPPPVVFIPISLASPIPPSPTPTAMPTATATPTATPPPSPTATATSTPAWREAGDPAMPAWSVDGEIIGPQVFRFEYYYLLKNGTLSDIPWDTNPSLLPLHVDVSGMQDVAAVVVDIAVIDPTSRTLVTDAQLASLNGANNQPPLLVDYAAGMTPGQLAAQWRAAIDANTIGLPQPAISGIRVYERYFYLSPPTLLTP